MGTWGIWHWLIVLAVVLLLFGGGGKIPKLMKDLGEGVTAFKKGLSKDDKNKDAAAAEQAQKQLEAEGSVPRPTVSHKDTVAG
jgi:sec-independent protein translocase protein TatA